MSSGSPRSRIDQFFTSRKKKPLSPYPTAEKANKDEKNSLEGSPSSKATLDNYLVTSHDDNFLVKCAFSDAVALSTHGSAHWSLTSEINLASEFTHKTFSPSSNLRTEEHPLKVEDTGEVQNGPCEILVVEETKKCNLGVEVDNAVDEDSRKETIGITSGGENLEHSQFAADFLSLYCGELSTGIRSSSEWNLKGQKRNGSPSLLIANSKTCKKKQCVSDSDHFESQVGHGYSPENLRSQPPDKLGKPGLCQPGELEETSCKEDKEYDSLHVESSAGLRECSKTPNCILGKAKFFTPGPPSNAKRSCGSSKWVSRSSNISPGDEFWVEAIQVADGLFAPIGGSVRVAEGLDVINGHCEPGNAHSVITANCSNKLLKDATSYTLIPQEAGTSSKSTDDGKEAELKESNVSDALIEKQPKENAKLPPIVLIGELSPLPVKRFDFLLEEKNLDKEAPQLFSLVNTTNITNGGSECSESISLTCKGNRTSGTLTPCDNAQTNRDGKLISSFPVSLSIIHDVPALGGTRGPHQLSEDASYLAVSKGSGVLMCQMRDVEIVESDKSLIPSPAILGNDGSAMSKEDTRGGLISYGKFDPDSTPSSSMPVKDSLQLSTWLPSEICSVYMKKGISKLYPWQVECLQVDGVLQKKNLVYCASTSAGKSFVAEILILRQAVSIGKMALLVLPYVSLCAEKAEHLEILLEPLGKHVRSFYGNQGGGTLPKDTSIAVCTIEKANFLINKLLEEGRLSEVGIVVIDELHMVGDQNRGYLLELMLTKLRYAAGEGNSGSCSSESSRTSSGKTDPAHGLQIVGMSATMPNVGSVAEWLKAALYQTDFRPVPLEEYIKVGNTVFNKKMEVVRTLPSSADTGGRDPDHVVELCNEVVQEGHSVLLFCSSRKGCETTARHVSNFLIGFSYIPRGDICEFSDASSAIEALRRCPAGLDPVLEETLPSGVAYHHAGLTVEEREIVEFCYRRGIVRVLTATSTLAAGVNLPARRVIFRQPRIGRDFIDGTRYRQMAGRAGRTGIDTRGESILICKPEEVKRIAALLNDCCPPLQSCLSEDKNGMTHAILEVVAGGIVQTASDIHRYVRCTLLNSTKPFQDVVKSAQDSLRWLCHRKFIEWNEETKLYSATSLGRASFGSSLSPEESLVVLDDLSRAREAFVLASDLHLVYLVTPINVDVEPDWELYYERFMELSALDQSVGNLVGVVEPFLMRMAHGAPMPTVVKSRGNRKGKDNRPQYQLVATNKSSLSDEQMVRVCRRFYVALMLLRLVQEVPVADVCEAFKVARGMVQALQENAGRFALMVTLFCERLGWHDLEGLVSKFQNRVSFGVRAEIAELTNIPYVKGSRARALYKAGFRTPLAIAEASLPEVVKALFESSSWVGQGTSQRLIQFGVAKKIKNGARKIVLDQAEEARAAAFSAFKSLGVLVPHFSRPLPPTSIGDDIKKGSGSPCSGEDTPTSSLNVNVRIRSAATTLGSDFAESKQDIQLYTKQVVDDTNKQPDDFGLVIRGECLTRKTDIGLGAAGKEISTGSTGELVEGSTQISGPEINISKTENSGASICPKLQNSGNCDAMLSRDLLSETLERTNDREPIPKHNTSMISEKGPVNASNTPGGFDSFLNLCDRAKEFYFDVHFSRVSDLNCPVPFEIHGLALCWENSPVYYINLPKDLVSSDGMNLSKKRCDFGHTESDDKGKDVVPNKWPELAKHRWNRIAKIMGQMGVRKVTWNLKCQIQVLQKAGISIQRVSGVDFDQKDQNDIQLIGNSFYLLPPVFVQNGIDMCLVAWILWPDEESRSSPNLEKEVKKRLSGEATAAANRDSRWKNQMRRAAHNGCCRRVAQTRALDSVLWKLLVSENMFEAFVSIESPLVKVLADMELWGIGVDMEGCLKARHLLGRKLKELEKEACTLAGVTFSLSSTADIANILYRHLKLPILEGCNKGKHHLSTDKHCLDLLRHQHPIVPVIKEHRTLSKLLNTTLGSICSRARLCMQSQKYKICGHWLQTSTATGRLSMEEPNLQCVEHTVDLRIHHDDKGNSGSVDEVLHRINARDFFIPTRENWVLLTADYSQIELRLMAHFSKDSSLIELLSMPDGDVFIMIAARWTGKLQFAVSSQERDQTKRLVYGILYGMGANTLAEQLGCSSDEAAEKIQSFKSSFPGVSSWLHEAVEFCRQKGYVETLKGRKRFLSKIKCGNSKEKAKAQRQAVNSICQGSAADIIKIAMIKIHSVIVEGWEMRNSETTPAIQFSMLKGRCRILLQVHDELVVEVDPSVIREGGALLQTSMENAVSLRGGKDMGLLSALPDGCSKRAAFINYEEEGKEDFHSIFFDSIEKQRLHTLAAVGYSLLILESTVNGTYLQGLNTSLDCI